MIDLDGAIDLHVHSAPDVYPRRLDDVALARAAESAGMRALLLKSHHTLTADRATLVDSHVKPSIFGGIALNLSVGGFNPVAVETAIAFGARQVWMPTLHARHCLQTATAEMFRAEARKGYGGLTLLDADDQPTPGLTEILEMIRDADILLGTGHLAPDESLRLLELARRMGLKRLLVTHPQMSFTRFSLAQMQRAVELGGVLEFDALACHPNWPERMPPHEAAREILAIGEAHCVLGSDGGQAGNEAAPSMLLDFAEALHANGVSQEALHRMMCDNPASLLQIS